jgi:hypothetical protein
MLAPLLTSSLKYFRHFVTSKGITAVVCFFSVRELASQLKMFVTQQCTSIKFCVLLQKSPAETLTMLQKEYGDRAMKNYMLAVSKVL